MPELIDNSSQQVFFQASEILATFADGTQIIYDSSDDIHATKSSAGDNVLVLQHEDDSRHLVRLYLTPPENDWRKNMTYSWQLSMAWMRVPGVDFRSDNETGWLYWNTENNVNSQIQADGPSSLFSTESITLHFRAMSRTPWKTQDLDDPPSTKIIMKNVLLGARLQQAEKPYGARYRPCQSAVCEIVDGVVTSKSMTLDGRVPFAFAKGVPWYIVIVATAIAIPVIFWGILRYCRRRILTQKYAPIVEGNDLKMDENG